MTAAGRVAVLVSGEGSNLQALLDHVHGRDGIEIVAVAASNPRAHGLERAEDAGVETGVFEVGGDTDRTERDGALAAWLERRDVTLVVLAGWMQLLSADFVRRFHGRLLNVHPSLLPAFPGLGAIERALEHGVRVTGVTIHFVDEGTDSGPIILQRAIDLPYAARVEEVEREIHAVEHELLPEAVRAVARGSVRIDPDDPLRVVHEEGDGGRE